MVKRRRDELETATGVTVHFLHLPPASFQQLDKRLREWAEWHAQTYPPGSEAGEVTSGTVSYEPELLQQDREELMVWEERPGPPEKTASQIMWYNIAYEKLCEVPAYDRAVDAPLRCPDPKRQRRASKRWKPLPHELSLPVLDSGASLAGGTEGETAAAGTDGGAGVAAAAAATAAVPRPARRAANRCFNCGSYAHTARECWREYNREQVEHSRKEFADARGEAAGGPRAAKRYFLGEEGGGRRGANGALPLEKEFGDVKPGQLSEALRSAMGLGKRDPPPWLNRMREMGIPPGYRVHKRRPLHTSAPAGAEAAAAAASATANGEVQNGSLHHPAYLEQPPQQQQKNAGEATGVLPVNGQQQGRQGAVGLSSQASLESGEWEEGERGGSTELGDAATALGDFLAFDEGGPVEQAPKSPQAAEPADAAPAEDFIPFDSGSLQEEAQEPSGSEGGVSGEWEGTWVDTAQFPGVNAPLPEGADPAKWEPHRSFSQPSQQQGTPHGSLPVQLQRLQGLHPPPPGQATPGLHNHFNLGAPSATTGATATPPQSSNGVNGYQQHDHYHQQQQQQQQGWQEQQQLQPSRLRHLPSAPAILQHAPSPPLPPHDGHFGSIYLGGSRGDPQEQQQYSPIVQQQHQQQHAQHEFEGLLSHQAILAPLPTQQQQQQQHYPQTQQYPQAQQPAYTVSYQHPGALGAAQVYGVSAADPGHLLAPGGLQPPLPPTQQGQQYVPAALPQYSQHQTYQPQPQLQQQPVQPIYAVQQQQPSHQQLQLPYQQQQQPGTYAGWQ